MHQLQNNIANQYNLYGLPLYYLSMGMKDYIETHQVFTTEGLRSVASSASTAETTLRRAVASGKVERVRRGLYVSKTGKFRGETPDSFAVVMAADPRSIISYHSALAAHGLAHNVSFECSFRSESVRSPFSYGGIRYVPFPQGQAVLTQVLRGGPGAEALVTTREQTMVDCLAHPGRAGGVEEVVRSLSLLSYVDCDAVLGLLGDAPLSLVARVGWLLELNRRSWRISDVVLDQLEGRLGKGPYRLDGGSSSGGGWSRRWRLLLPVSEEEALSWAE